MASLFHDGCECYFQHELDLETRFCARRGVHEVWCPCYVRSLDPVDYMADEEFKAEYPVVRELIARERRSS